jgi:hypothetical protein
MESVKLTKKTNTSNVKKLETYNPKIIDFYDKYKLSFDSMNLLIIEIAENIINDISGKIDNKMTNDILSTIKTDRVENDIFRKEFMSVLTMNAEMYKNEIATIKSFNGVLTNDINNLRELLMRMNNDISNSITAKLYDIRQSYVDDLREIVSKNGSTNILKIIELVEKENNILIDKTIKTINETLPKSQSQNMTQIELLILNFKSELNKNIDTLKDNKSNVTLEDVSSLIDSKYNNLLNNIHQTIINQMTSTEDRINKNINEIKETGIVSQSEQQKVNSDLLTYLNKSKNPTLKGSQSEYKLLNILQELYQKADITDTSNEVKKCDMLLKRDNKPNILIENKIYSGPVSKEEVIKFCRDIEYQNQCGIMLSQTSVISTKENFQIDIMNNNILIYVTNCNYDTDKISLAVNIIDHLYPKINELSNKNTFSINNDTLGSINDEYKRFINQREAMKHYINDVNKKLLNQLTELELPNLSNVLLSKFTIVQDVNLVCNICKKFVGINKKSLSKHKNSCKNKIITPIDESDSEQSKDDIPVNKSLTSSPQNIKNLLLEDNDNVIITSIEDEKNKFIDEILSRRNTPTIEKKAYVKRIKNA